LGSQGKEEVDSIKIITKTNNFAIICHPKNPMQEVLFQALPTKYIKMYFSIYNNDLLFKKKKKKPKGEKITQKKKTKNIYLTLVIT